MKAAYRTEYGLSDVLSVREIDIPDIGHEDILIRVAATTVNRTDCANLTGRPLIMHLIIGLFRPKNPVPGTDFAGIVEKTGKAVIKFKKGDRVWGFRDSGCGSQAEFIRMSENGPVGRVPKNIKLSQATACIEGAHYAINFINKVKINAGDRVLVNGGTGAIGSAMIQLLKAQNVQVTATCRKKHEAVVRALGATKVIDYENEDFTKCDESYDYVFDCVGKSSFGKSKYILKPGGTYISSELGPYNQNPFLALITPILQGKRVRFPIPSNIQKSMDHICSLIEKEAFQPLIDRSYQLDHVAEAYDHVLKGQKVGNVLLQINNEL